MKATKLAVLIGAAVLFVTPSEASIKDDVKAFFANVTENVKNTIRSVQKKFRSTIVEKHTDSVEKARVAVDGKKGLEKISEKLATIKTGDAFAADLDAKLDALDKKVADRLAQIAEKQKEGAFKELLQGIADMLGQKVTPELTEEVTMLANDVTTAGDADSIKTLFSLTQTQFVIPVGDGEIVVTIDNDGIVTVSGEIDGVVITGKASLFYGDELLRIKVALNDKIPGVPMSFDIFLKVGKDNALVYGLDKAVITLENAGLAISMRASVTDNGEPGAQTGEAEIRLEKDANNFLSVFTVVDKKAKEYGVGVKGGVEFGEYGDLAAGVEFDLAEGGELNGVGVLVDDLSLGVQDKTILQFSDGLLKFVKTLGGGKEMKVSTKESKLVIDVLPNSMGSDSLVHLVADGSKTYSNVEGYCYLIGKASNIRLTRFKAQIKGVFDRDTFVGKVLIPANVQIDTKLVIGSVDILDRLRIQVSDADKWVKSSGAATATGWKVADEGDYQMGDIFYGDVSAVDKPTPATTSIDAVLVVDENDGKEYYTYTFLKSCSNYIVVSGGSYKTAKDKPLTKDTDMTAVIRPGYGKYWSDGTADAIEIKWKAKVPVVD